MNLEEKVNNIEKKVNNIEEKVNQINKTVNGIKDSCSNTMASQQKYEEDAEDNLRNAIIGTKGFKSGERFNVKNLSDCIDLIKLDGRSIRRWIEQKQKDDRIPDDIQKQMDDMKNCLITRFQKFVRVLENEIADNARKWYFFFTRRKEENFQCPQYIQNIEYNIDNSERIKGMLNDSKICMFAATECAFWKFDQKDAKVYSTGNVEIDVLGESIIRQISPLPDKLIIHLAEVKNTRKDGALKG